MISTECPRGPIKTLYLFTLACQIMNISQPFVRSAILFLPGLVVFHAIHLAYCSIIDPQIHIYIVLCRASSCLILHSTNYSCFNSLNFDSISSAQSVSAMLGLPLSALWSEKCPQEESWVNCRNRQLISPSVNRKGQNCGHFCRYRINLVKTKYCGILGKRSSSSLFPL